MGYEGTYSPNRRPVVSQAPDCLVYLNGEPSLPSGASPEKRIDIQPLVTSVSTQLGVEQSPGNAQISLTVPEHYVDDIFQAGHPIITSMMEVQIYMKGAFTVGGAPRYYPAFWGVTESVQTSESPGSRTIDISCQDILYWWTVQRININPSYLAQNQAQIGGMNVEGSGYFTRKNPFDIMYTLARYAYGDSVNADIFFSQQQVRPELSNQERLSLMDYWTRKWGRIAYALRMFGPNGDVLQGSRLASVLDDRNNQTKQDGKAGSANSKKSEQYTPYQGVGNGVGVDFSQISPFKQVLSNQGQVETWTSEHQTKKEIADSTKDAIGYEFFMDTTGELIFKPPFYNMDVIPNKPVSWLRKVDVQNFTTSENPPDATMLTVTGNYMANYDIGMANEVKPRATYIDYKLVQKYGWKPGTYNNEFLSNPKTLFFYLVDQLDKQNARIHTATASIPLRPELRLGYPVYVEHKDSYYYLESINHSFSYGSQCTSSLTLSSRRRKFYAPFDSWATGAEPEPGDTAKVNYQPAHLSNRPVDRRSGNPEGDRNVILKYDPETPEEEQERAEAGGRAETYEREETEANAVKEDLISLRTQFILNGEATYSYQVDPDRGEEIQFNENTGRYEGGPLVQLEAYTKNGNFVADFPVSDERGYEVIGAFPYGRSVQLDKDGFKFSYDPDKIRTETSRLLHMKPQENNGGDDLIDLMKNNITSNREQDPENDVAFQINPNNYGRRISEISPGGFETPDKSLTTRQVAESFTPTDPPDRDIEDVSATPFEITDSDKDYQFNSNVQRWKSHIEEIREEEGISEEQFPTRDVLAFIQVESGGDPSAHDTCRTRNEETGECVPSQFYGLVQIGIKNADDLDRKNTDFEGKSNDDIETGRKSIRHMMQYMKRYEQSHGWDDDLRSLNWKSGPTFTKKYRESVERGAPPEELKRILKEEAPKGSELYLARKRNAKKVWTEENQDAETEQPVDEYDPQAPANAFINSAGTEEFDQAAERGQRKANDLFAQELAVNAALGLNFLPEGINPPRNENILEDINRFLSDIYRKAHEREKSDEKELRGENRRIIREPSRSDIPTTSDPTERKFVDTPIGREEVQNALDAGQDPSEVFGPDGVVEDLEDQFNDD